MAGERWGPRPCGPLSGNVLSCPSSHRALWAGRVGHSGMAHVELAGERLDNPQTFRCPQIGRTFSLRGKRRLVVAKGRGGGPGVGAAWGLDAWCLALAAAHVPSACTAPVRRGFRNRGIGPSRASSLPCSWPPPKPVPFSPLGKRAPLGSDAQSPAASSSRRLTLPARRAGPPVTRPRQLFN